MNDSLHPDERQAHIQHIFDALVRQVDRIDTGYLL